MENDTYSDTSSTQGPAPQQEIQMLFSCADFDHHITKDVENVCCVIVTSTLCKHSGIRKLVYPKKYVPPEQAQSVKPSGSHRGGDGDASDSSHEDEDEEDEAEEEGEEDDDENSAAFADKSNFFQEMSSRLITTDRDLHQRRHVRFFHVCACAEDEVNIKPIMARDPAFSGAMGRRRVPSPTDVLEMHAKAYQQLMDLLQLLEIRSTPCMLFFLRGQVMRYSMLEDESMRKQVGKVAVGDKDTIRATGSNYVKWRRTLFNAVVVRNDVLKQYDADLREKARQARRAARREERRRRKAKAEAEESEEDEEEYN